MFVMLIFLNQLIYFVYSRHQISRTGAEELINISGFIPFENMNQHEVSKSPVYIKEYINICGKCRQSLGQI